MHSSPRSRGFIRLFQLDNSASLKERFQLTMTHHVRGIIVLGMLPSASYDSQFSPQ